MAPRLKVTDDEYDLLTEEEREGLKEFQAEFEAEQAAEEAEINAAAAGEPEPDPKTPPAEDEGADEEEDDEAGAGESEEGEEGEGEEGEEGEGEGEGEEEGEGEGEEEGEDEPLVITPPPAQRLSEAEEQRLVAIKAELKAVAQKFDDGDITAVEMREQQEALEDERDQLREKRALANMSVQNAVNTWYYTTIPTFMAQHPEYKDGTLRHKLLDTIVRELQVASPNPTDPKILFDAHAKVIAEFGEVEPKGKKKKANGHADNGKQRVTPPTLGNVPSSDQQQVTPPNKFARLDRLNGVEYEKALAKLSPADREYYLQGG